MKKVALVSSMGQKNFLADMTKWLSENSEAKIVSISHSEMQTQLPASGGQTAMFLAYTALIVYEQ